ncbi:hypothetical protein [Croceitalea rosinachiae]|uniref:Uncharacterized protein n=1 Tax=Croceitalea rosinachiae TaxID=3075596 RepID=A0ABU3ABU6_9FLAO|nr:hypothetical protein [Croceitalea sp. F388]MDT0607656.1 hypothetical protein [Croceitalea sp. F388]
MKTPRIFYVVVLLSVLFAGTSCEKTEACEEANSGTITLQNLGTEGNVHLYINPVRIGSNTPGDLSVAPGETKSIDLAAGVPNILVRRITSSCVGDRCQIRSTTLEERTLDISACETINMAY